MDQERIETLLDQWEDLQKEGREVSADELCIDCPELLEEVRHRIDGLKAMAWLDKTNDGGKPSADSDTAFKAPKLPVRFQNQQLIGTGGFGQVWKAFDTQLERLVAIKVPHPDRHSSPGLSEQILAEARRASHFTDKGIVRVLDVGSENGVYYIVSDFIDGGSLADTIRNAPLDTEASLRVVTEVADALHYAHRKEVIHRDVKPDNILLSKEGKAFITDFGIAISEEQPVRERSSTVGTLAYMSPEQVDGKHATAQSDIYSLGVVLYQLLTNRLPFRGESVSELRDEILAGRPKHPREINEEVSEQIDRICLKAMALDPDGRYSTAKDFGKELAAASMATRRSPWRVVVGGFLFVVVILMSLAGRWLWNARQDAMTATEKIRQQVKTASQKAHAVRSDFKPENAVREIALQRGHILFAKKRFDEAMLAYTEAIDADPKSSEAFHRRGACQFNMGDCPKAIADYDEAIRLDSTNGEVYNNRALANSKSGRFDEGVADAERAIQLGPASRKDYRSTAALAYSVRGIHSGNAGRKEDALDDFNKAIQFDPNDAAFYDRRGSAFLNLHRFDEAIADLSKATAMDSTNAQYREHLNYAFAGKAKAKQVELDRAKARP